MKKCPYCAEEIQDEAIKCRYCGSDLTVAAPNALSPASTQAPAGPRVGEGALRYSHSGYRYLLGYGTDFFGIWDRDTPGGPTLRFPRTDEGWNLAYNQFSGLEPRSVEVPHKGTAPDLRDHVGIYRPAHTRALGTMIFVGAIGALALIGAGYWGWHLGALQGGGLWSGGRQVALNLHSIITLSFIPSAIMWLLWQYRAHANLRPLGASDLRYRPGWVVAWWFIPLANIVLPYLTMRELWKASDPSAGTSDWRARRTTPLIGFWWAGRLVTNVLLQIALVINAGTSFGSASSEAGFFLAGDLALAIWSVLAILLVLDVDRRQQEKWQRMQAWTRSVAAVG